MSDQVELSKVLHNNAETAQRCLESVGGNYIADLDLVFEHPELGKMRRMFAVLGNLIAQEAYLEDRSLLRLLKPMLESADNERVLAKLQAGKLDYIPVNKRTVRKLVPCLHEAGVHLPWAFRPMNFDFGAKLEALCHSRPLRFHVFYSQGVDLHATDGLAVVKRVFSLPVQGSAHGTFQEPIFDEMLDEDVGLFLEANVRVP